MNFNKKNNKNGFTLVELIVVVSIFGAIMVAILNFMRPANDIHNDTQSTMDSNIISSGLIEYMDDNLRYATNVLVLKDYTGVPKVSDKGLVGDYPVAFTDCLIIDNQNPRGYQLKNYDPNKNDTATRLKARGGIIRIENLDKHGINFNITEDAYLVKGADFYDKFAFDIRVGTNILDKDFKKDSNLSTLQISLTAYQPVYENGEFVFTKKKFDRGTSTDDEGNLVKNKGAVINFTNINAIVGNDSAKLVFYDMNLQGAVAQAELLYNKKNKDWGDHAFPLSTKPTDLTEYQEKFYNPHTALNYTSYENGESVSAPARYTYIFFQKSKSISQCKVNFVYAEDSPVFPGMPVQDSVSVKYGSNYAITAKPADAPSGYNAPYWLGPKGDTIDVTVPYKIENDTTFTVHYTKKEPSPYDVNIQWWYKGEIIHKEIMQKAVLEGEFVKASPPASPEDPSKYDCVWVLKGTNTPYDTVNINGPKDFEAKVTELPKVKFSTNGTDIDIQFWVKKGSAVPTVSVPSPDPSKIPSGKVFDKWVLKDAEDKGITTEIQADCTFIAKFKDKPAGVNGWSIISSPSESVVYKGSTKMWDNNDYSMFDINLMFSSENTSIHLDGYKVKLTLNKPSSVNFYYGGSVVSSGNTITIEPYNWGTNIGDGDRHNLNLNGNPLYLLGTGIKIEKIELVSVSIKS